MWQCYFADRYQCFGEDPEKQRQCVTLKGWYLCSQLCGVITHKISARNFQHCQIPQDLQLFSHSKNLYKTFTKGTHGKKILTVIINDQQLTEFGIVIMPT